MAGGELEKRPTTESVAHKGRSHQPAEVFGLHGAEMIAANLKDLTDRGVVVIGVKISYEFELAGGLKPNDVGLSASGSISTRDNLIKLFPDNQNDSLNTSEKSLTDSDENDLYKGCCDLGDFWGESDIYPKKMLRSPRDFSAREERVAYNLVFRDREDPGFFQYRSLSSVANAVIPPWIGPIWMQKDFKSQTLDSLNKETQEKDKSNPKLKAPTHSTTRMTIINVEEVKSDRLERKALIEQERLSLKSKYEQYLLSPEKALTHLEQFDDFFRNSYPEFSDEQRLQILDRTQQPHLILNPRVITFDKTAGWSPIVAVESSGQPKNKEMIKDIDIAGLYAVKTKFVLDELREDYQYSSYEDRARALKNGEVDGIDAAPLKNQTIKSLALKIQKQEVAIIKSLAEALDDSSSAPQNLSKCVTHIKSDPFFSQFDNVTILQALLGQLSVNDLRKLAPQ